jgi:asparagine synthase (glutamine-hydrolysing)
VQRIARILRDSSLPFEELYFSKITLCDRRRLELILNPDYFAHADWNGSTPPAYLAHAFESDWPDLAKASYADLRFRLVEDMLVKVDRTSMAHSLEVRSPLLDHRLVEFVFKLPPALKLRGRTSKAILRDAIGMELPPRTLRKPKQGFEIPLRSWLRGELREMTWDYLGGRSLRADAFDRAGIAQLLSEHAKGKADHSHVIWALLAYATWQDEYLKHAAPVPALASG